MKNFKKILSLLIIFLISTNLIFAQNMDTYDDVVADEPEVAKVPSNHAVYLGGGWPASSNVLMTSIFQTLFTGIFTAGQAVVENEGIATFQLGYDWFCTENVIFGGLFTVEPYKQITTSGGDNPSKKESLVVSYGIEGVFKCQYGWEKVRLYHGLGLGLNIDTSQAYDSPICSFAMNIIPIGVRVGKEQGINFFADVGIGTTSLLNAGVSYRF